jgi:hypothetical protein
MCLYTNSEFIKLETLEVKRAYDLGLIKERYRMLVYALKEIQGYLCSRLLSCEGREEL